MIDYREAGSRILDARNRRISMKTPKETAFESLGKSHLARHGESHCVIPSETEPPLDSLNYRANSVAEGLCDLNSSLEDLRYRLFGEAADEKDQPPMPLNGQVPCVEECIGAAGLRLRIAHEHMRNILNRI